MSSGTPDNELREIRARDARTTIYDSGTVHERVTIGGGGSLAAVDRRALLREVDRLRNEVAEMRRSMDGLEYALSEAEAARETTQSRLQQRLAECERDAARYRFLTNLPKTQAQAFFWNWDSRKQRADAIDAALAAGSAGKEES